MVDMYPEVSPSIAEVEAYFKNEVGSTCAKYQRLNRTSITPSCASDYFEIINKFVEEMVSNLKTKEPHEVSANFSKAKSIRRIS